MSDLAKAMTTTEPETMLTPEQEAERIVGTLLLMPYPLTERDRDFSVLPRQRRIARAIRAERLLSEAVELLRRFDSCPAFNGGRASDMTTIGVFQDAQDFLTKAKEANA